MSAQDTAGSPGADTASAAGADAILESRPPAETLRWVTEAVGARSKVTSIRKLLGGASSAMHAVNIDDARGHRHRLVLRRFIRSDWLAREPDLAEREASVLQLLQGSDVPAPELVAVDSTGKVCDVPALLMTRLPGRVEFAPIDTTSWLTKMAAALPPIHAVIMIGYAVQPYQTYNKPSELKPPAWSKEVDAWESIFRLLAGPAPETPHCFIHRDYHPGNVLWSRNRLTGIVDWTNASIGPPGIDVGHCRLNLVQLHGVGIADRFLDIYRRQAGGDADYHPYWDAITAIEFLPEPGVYLGWRDAGLANLTRGLLRARLDKYATSIAARI